MSNYAVNLPDALTMVAYVVLGFLAAFGLAHGLAIIGSMFRPPWRRWASESEALASELRRLAEETKGLVSGLDRSCHHDGGGAAKSLIWQGLASLRSQGPEGGLAEWLSRLEPGLDAPLRTALETAERGEWADPVAAVEETLDADHSRWQGRLGVLIAAGPPAGAAPTMSGAMSFLAAYADQAREGVAAPPMAAIRDALLTTYIGCSVCVAAIVLLAVVSGQFHRSQPLLVQAVNKVREHYQTWLSVTREAQTFIEEAEP